MRLVFAFVATSLLCSAADNAPRIFYSKHFPGSKPELVLITLDRNGKVEYRESADDEDPLLWTMTEDQTREIFALAEKLDWFRRALESGLNVARMGEKTFRMENVEPKGEVKFNYTMDEDGKLILDWFERFNESAMLRVNLSRAVKFDKLGVHKAILQLESAWDRKRIVGVEQYLPLLDRVVKNESYMNMARERAAALADVFRANGKPKAE